MSNTQTLTLYGPAILLILIAIWGLGRILYLRISAGVSVLAILSKRKTSAERCLGIIAVILDGYLLLRPAIPELDQWLYLQQSPAPMLGISIMATGLALMLFCQITMGRAWRIGIPAEKEESQHLVTHGIYAYSRNPIYLGVMIFLTGCFITLPGPLTAISTILTWAFLRTIIAQEETFMANNFGPPYKEYTLKVRRWI